MKAGIALAAALAALVLAAPSQGAVVAQIGGTVGYVALPGERNNVVVTREGANVTLDDLGVAVISVTGPGCAQVASHRVRCIDVRTVHLDLGDGDDSAVVNGAVYAYVSGGAGDDVLRGGAAGDVLYGGPGDDVLDGGGAGDVMNGDAGSDLADYTSRTAGVRVTLDGVANDGERGEGDNVLRIENVAGGGGPDVLVGDASDNYLYGGRGNDALAGAGGHDVLDGGPGRDGVNALDPPASVAAGTRGDAIACGSDGDRVYGDSADSIAGDCETVDRSGVLGYAAQVDAGPPGPELGKSVVVEPISGTILITPPASGSAPDAPQPVPALPPVPLDSERNIPVGSVLDARFGTVQMTTAVDQGPTTQTGRFSSGSFQVFQDAVAGALADLVLRGGKSFNSCPAGQRGPGVAARAATAHRGGRPVRRLWSSAHGNFRTKGRFAAATVRGTEWLTEDRCEGTLVRVKSGEVAVHDVARGKTVLVKAGKEYLVRTPAR